MVEFNALNENDWFKYQDSLFYVKHGSASGKTYNAFDDSGNAWFFEATDLVVRL